MVDCSDLIVFCVERQSGGAYQTMRYAMKREAAYINLPEINEDLELSLIHI